MTEEKKVITIDDVDYTEDQLTNTAIACINHLRSLDQKIASAKFNVEQLEVGRDAFMLRLKEELRHGQEDSSVSS